MQVAWQNGLIDLAMPFMIQFMKDYVGKVDMLMADRKDNMEARKVRLTGYYFLDADALVLLADDHKACLCNM